MADAPLDWQLSMQTTTRKKTALFTATLAGFVFGLGLILSGMVNPDKVLSFLDIVGVWDPSLAFVMLGSILVAAIAFFSTQHRQMSLLQFNIQRPSKKTIDRPLILGSLCFGIGWGLAGICPGPALVLLGTFNLKGIVFVIFMLLGMWIFEILSNRK